MRNAKFTMKNRSAQRSASFDAVEFTPVNELDEDIYDEEEIEELDEELEYEEAEDEEDFEVLDEEPEYEEVVEEPPVRRRGRPKKASALPPRRSAAKSAKSSAGGRLDDDLTALLLGSTPTKSGANKFSVAANSPKSSVSAAGSIYSLTTDRSIPAFDSTPTAFKPLPAAVKKQCAPRRGGWFRFCLKTLLLGGFTALACWSAYGVSLESNLPFWRETLQNQWGRFAGIVSEQVHELFGLIFFG